MLTVKCTAMLPPAGTVSPVHVTVAAGERPAVVGRHEASCCAGIGSVIVTPVAAALPMFLSVIV